MMIDTCIWGWAAKPADRSDAGRDLELRQARRRTTDLIERRAAAQRMARRQLATADRHHRPGATDKRAA